MSREEDPEARWEQTVDRLKARGLLDEKAESHLRSELEQAAQDPVDRAESLDEPEQQDAEARISDAVEEFGPDAPPRGITPGNPRAATDPD